MVKGTGINAPFFRSLASEYFSLSSGYSEIAVSGGRSLNLTTRPLRSLAINGKTKATVMDI